MHEGNPFKSSENPKNDFLYFHLSGNSSGITLLSVPHGLLVLYQGGGFNNFLQALFDIIIGIELLKMLCRHDLDSVVEVLMFAVAREMVINHMPIIETLIGIIAIAVLFSIRKFLFVSALDKENPDRMSGEMDER